MQIINYVPITDARLLSSDIPEQTDDYPEWDETYSYVTGQRVVITTPGIHRIYECIWHTPNCLDKYPLDYLDTTPALWELVSWTNRWKLFDQIVQPDRANVSNNVPGCDWAAGVSWQPGTSWNTATRSSAHISLLPGQIIDAVALMNVDSSSIDIVMTDPIAGEVYAETKTPTAPVNFNGVYDGLPAYPDAVLDIFVRNSIGDVNIGELIVGTARTLGTTTFPVSVGLTDFSRKTDNGDGTYSIEERTFSKRIDFKFTMQTALHTGILRLLVKYLSVPLVWIVVPNYSAMLAFGFYRDLKMTIKNFLLSECSLSIEGLGGDLVNATPTPDDWVPPWDGITHLVVPGVPTVAVSTAKIEEAPVEADAIALTVPAVPAAPVVATGIYEMLGNCTISNAEPLVVTKVGHGLVNDQQIKLFNTMVLTITDSSCVEANGTRALIFTGGGSPSAQATGTYTVSGNTITAVSITTGGTGYSSAPTVATQTGDGAVVATLGDWRGSVVDAIYYNGSGSLPLPLASDTVYFVENKTDDTFNLTLTIGGSTIDSTTDGWGVHTLYVEA